MGVGSGEGAAPQPKKHDYTKNNELLPQRQDTTVIKSYSAGKYDINKTLNFAKIVIKCRLNDRRRKNHGLHIIVVSEHLLAERRKSRYWLSNVNEVAIHLPMHSSSGP